MKEKITTATIGIPAYNEEANIKSLLASLLKQKEEGFKLEEIIVVSDGSTDKTVQEARSINSSKIKIRDRKARKGAGYTQNEILRFAKGDILVLLDADVLPEKESFIQEIIKPILKNSQVGLVGADTVSAPPETFVERVISDSHEMKQYYYRKINKGNNLYLCHGRARAFAKKFYSQIRWQGEGPEDGYSYLSCLEKGFKFVFCPKAAVVFRSPSTVFDHAKQSSRFANGKKIMEGYFPAQLVSDEYYISPIMALRTFGRFLLKKPITTLAYLAIVLYVRLFFKNVSTRHLEWESSKSTKVLNSKMA